VESEFEACQHALSLFLGSKILLKCIISDNEVATMQPNPELSSLSSSNTGLVTTQDHDQEPSSEQNKILVSTKLLNSLLAKVGRIDDVLLKLQIENSSLRQELSCVKQDLSTLQQNCGGDYAALGPDEIL
jgi:hypothetical protein